MSEPLPIPEVRDVPNSVPAPAQVVATPAQPDRPGDLPAYPCANALKAKYRGLTIRDFFASQAMQAMMSVAVPGPDGRLIVGAVQTATGGTITETAYRVADAMIAARGK